MDCTCPDNSTLSAISKPDCAFKFDQIVRIFFQLGEGAPFDATKIISDQAAWTAALADATVDKIVGTPIFDSLVIPPSEPNYVGGNDNSTAFGLQIYTGENSILVDTPQFRNLKPEIAEEIRALSCKSLPTRGVGALRMYMVTRHNMVVHETVGVLNQGIPVTNVSLSSVGSEGFNADNIHRLRFTLDSGWDKNIAMTKADFNILAL